ncbi:ATP-binding protein [Desulfobacterales bacterium HSG16]|nr:ATP-binding protein [Desulfobacterales bacterium HSG16]
MNGKLKKAKSILSSFRYRGIGHRFAVYILLFSGAVTLVITIIQLVYDYQKDVSIINRQLQEMQILYHDTLSSALWMHNKTGMILQLDGMMRLPTILYVQVDNELGEKIEYRGTYREQRTIKKTFELSHVHRSRKIILGKMYILADLNVIYKRLFHKLIIIFISQGIKTFLVSFFIFLLFQALVGNSLITMAAVAKKISSGSYRKKLDIGRDDELSDVSASFNNMTGKLVANMERLEEEVGERCRVQRMLEEHKNNLENLVQEKTADLIKTNEVLKVSMDAAEAANLSKSMFLANMSHEIRTPINAILGFSVLLKDEHFGPLNHKQIEHLGYIIESTNRLLFLISDILDISRVEAGKIKISNTVLSTDRLWERINKTYAIEAASKRLTFQLKTASNFPEYLIGDECRIEQVLKNLISNAFKFTEQGKIDVFAKMKSADEVMFEVRDTGIGIPEDKIDGLFEKFYQVDSSYTKKFAGAGLGLAISKELVELMGGKIWVESDVGKGSSFYYTLKTNIPSIDAIDLYRKDTQISEPVKPLKGMRILLAEDDELNHKAMTYFLERDDYIVGHATTGNEVLAALETNVYDIVLMDIQMPEMDGVTATKKIRNSDSGKFDPKIPVIALTAYAMEGDKDTFLKTGMDDYLAKPVNLNHLIEKINKHAGDGLSPIHRIEYKTISKEEAGDDDCVNDILGFIEDAKDDSEFLNTILTSFPNDANVRMENLKKALLEKDSNKVALASHKITALFSAIFIRSAASITQELESAARSDQMNKCEKLFLQLEPKMCKVIEYIQSTNGTNQV